MSDDTFKMRFSATLLFIALLTSSASAAPRERRPGGKGPARGGNRPAPPAPPAVGGGAPPPPPPPPGNGGGNGGGNGNGNGGGGGNQFTGGTGDPSQVNSAVIPASFGITAGANGCTGVNNAPIPCNCPPAPNDPQFLGGLASLLTQGFFPDASVPSPIDLRRFNDAADRSVATNRDRATAMIQVMQSLSGNKGQGCPGVSTPVLVAQQRTGVLG